MINGYYCGQSWTTTVEYENIDTEYVRGKKGRDLYLHVYVFTVVQCK